MKLRKPTIYLISAALTALLAMSACVDDYFYKTGKGRLEPGTPVDITIGLQVPDSQEAVVGSRTSTETETDRTVYDLYIFIFNQETNQLKSKYYFSQLSSKSEISCDPAYSSTGSAVIKRDSRSAGRIEHIHTTAGPSRIVAVANCNRKGSAMILDRLSKVETVQDLRNIMVSTVDPDSKQPDFEQSLTVMSGYYCDNDEEHNAHHLMTPCDFVNDESDINSHKGYVDIQSERLPGTIWLTPLQSRVKFLVLSDCPKGTNEIPAGHFELESWQVYNIPGLTPLFCRGYDEEHEPLEPNPVKSIVITRFDNDSEVKKDELDKNATYDAIYGFNFFVADNHPGKGDPEKIKTYGDRAAWTGADLTTFTPPDEKTYTNAPAGATYVVLRGTYNGASYTTESGEETPTLRNVSGNVIYTIFLGHNSGSGPSADNTDFNTYRNYNYTYIVKVSGVDKITVEVNKDVEDRPDAEGDIITSTSNVVDLDAHYEQRVVSIKKQNVIDAIAGGKFQVSVTVPLFRITRRAYVFDPENPDKDVNNALPYMQWLEFYQHPSGQESRKFIHYTEARGSGTNKNTLNVKQFMQRLYEYAKDPTAPDELTFTVYFDEYVYNTDPANPATKVKWTDLLRDGQSRRFTMLGTSKFSNDHNSSYTTSGTTFVQRCMQTIYDVDMAGLERGWATECVEEDIFEEGTAGIPFGTFKVMPGYQYSKTQKPDSKFGRQNCWRVNSGPADNSVWQFTKLIGDDGYMTKPSSPSSNNVNETNLLSVCLQRNRDLNGNGRIDREEFKWYVPSLEQMQLLYMGYGALTDDVQLYNAQRERQIPGHITSSQYSLRHYLTSSNNKKVWAEEGLSYSALGLTVETGNWNYDKVLYVRCIRTLGTDDMKGNAIPWDIEKIPEAQFQSIFEYTPYPRTVTEVNGDEIITYKEHKHGRITMRYLNPQSLINVPRLTETPGLVHTFSENNFATYQFEFADTILSVEGTSEPVVNDKTKLEEMFTNLREVPDFTPCSALGPGWRIPTITELTMMQWVWNEQWNDIKQEFPQFNVQNLTAADEDKNKWCAFTKFNGAFLLSRTEYYYKSYRLQPPHGGGVRTFHVFDNDHEQWGAQLAQFSLMKESDAYAVNPTNHNRKPTIRCVRSYATTTPANENKAPGRRTASPAKRKLRKK